MGITGELVRSVFSKTRSTKTKDTHIKGNNVMDKKRWKTSVRAYLCGDELFNSVLAEDESASVKSSEATVTQPVPEEDNHSQEGALKNENSEQDQKHHFDEETAAIIIQTAFRSFMVRHLRMTEAAGANIGFLKGVESPSRESLATSIEVQTGNSVGVISMQEDPSVSNKLHQKPKSLAFRPKEDWDDSTVDSSVSKMRIQNRREAMTRRERALAYAFSQQLRICSKKKQIKSDGMETNMGWSWLERWMATRQPEGSSVEDCIKKQLKEQATTIQTRAALVKNKFLDLSFEEKESCGSSEVPVHIDASKDTEMEDKDGCKTPRNRLKVTRNMSRRKTVTAYHYTKEYAKVSRRDASRDYVKNKRQKMKQLGSNRETVCKDSPSPLLSPDHSLYGQNSKSDP